MITRTVEELYEVVATRGGLTRAVECERMVSTMRFTAGIAAQPVAAEGSSEPPISGFSPTVPSRGNTVPCTRREGT